MSRLINRRGSATPITLLAALVLALAGCTVSGPAPIDIGTPEKVAERVTCVAVVAISDAIKAADEATAPGARAELRRWGLDPNDVMAVGRVREALGAKRTKCNSTPTRTPTAAPETPSPAPAATPTPAPTSKALLPRQYLGWDMIAASPPTGLEATITDHAEAVGFSWSDVQGWASTRLPSGNEVDARVVLVFGQDDTSATDARASVGIKANVPVVRVATCTEAAGAGCPDSGVRTILAPISAEGVPQLKAGVILTEGFPLVAGLTGHQIKD